jgi:glycosyltransferase involved in cell wall biosynthesis
VAAQLADLNRQRRLDLREELNSFLVLIANSFYPPWRGGAEVYVQNLARHLITRGHKVSVICADDPLTPGEYNEGGVVVKRLRLMTRLYGTPLIAGLSKELSNLETDIFHANFPSPYIAYNVARVSLRRKIPAVLTWHNDLPAVTLGAKLLIETHDHLILPRYIRKYRRIISTSQTYAEQSRILPKLGSLVTVVPNGVDCERFHTHNDGSPIRDRFNLQNKFTLLFVGALTKWHGYKGLDVLLQSLSIAIKKDNNLTLLVVGDGDLKPAYHRLSQQLKVDSNVLFAGNVSDADLPLYYAAADVLALPSKDMSEGFGLTLLEANASGKPAVASSVGGVPSVIRDGYNGILVPPNDTKALAAAVLRLAIDPSEAEEMGRNGRRVAEAHDWAIVAEKTEQVYLEAISEGSHSSQNGH